MKIDIFAHILPLKYKEALYEVIKPGFWYKDVIERTPTLFDLEYRFRVMDKYDGLMQVLTLSSPALEDVVDPMKAVDLSRMANDEMADLVLKYPDRFAAAVACLPLGDIDAALAEIDRAIVSLKFRGIQLFTPANGKPLDAPEFMPIYKKMSEYSLPILVHPERPPSKADYANEDASKYMIYAKFGWPWETTVAMTRLVFSGVLERYPNLKIITHHSGGMVPFFEQRMVGFDDRVETNRGPTYKQGLTKQPLDYFKMFCCDTAVYGSVPALMCAYAFFGADNMLFGTDMPYDNQHGHRYTRETIRAVQEMAISSSEINKIFSENARKILRLPI